MKRREFLQSLLLAPLFKPKLKLPKYSPGEIVDVTPIEPTIEESNFDWMTTARHGSVSSCAGPTIWDTSEVVFEDNDIVNIHDSRGATVAIRFGDIDALQKKG